MARFVVGGIAVSTATAYMYQSSPSLNLFQVAMPTECAAEYKIPNDAQVTACKAEMMEFVTARRNMAPLLVRLSWHDAGTYDVKKNNGGPRGCMRVAGGEADHGANAGL
jgi:catalase (peroxidase I)